MPFIIVGLSWNDAVIILTGGSDYGHGAWMWSGMKRLWDRADRAVTGASLLSTF